MNDVPSMILHHVTFKPHEDEAIPATSGIYIVFSGQECLYVGQSRNIRLRWHRHEYRSTFRDTSPAVTLTWILTPVSNLHVVERQTIEKFCPRLNVNFKSRVAPKHRAPLNRVVVRLNDDVHQKLVELAKRERRSLHGQLLRIVERALKAEDYEVTSERPAARSPAQQVQLSKLQRQHLALRVISNTEISG
jgi:hypothetical protein